MLNTDQAAIRKNRNILRWIVRMVALIALAILAVFRMERFWLPVLLSGIGTELLWNRWYCGWVCPVACVSGISRIFRKPGSYAGRKYPILPVLRSKWFSAIWLAGLSALFITCLIFGLRPRLFVWISAIGIFFGLFFPGGTWCGSLCPWGRIMQLEANLLNKSKKPAELG